MSQGLTPRQVQILTRLAEVARALGIAERTLRWHLANAHERLGTRSRVQMMAVALRRRLLPCPCPHTDQCPLCPEPPDEEP